MFTLSFPKSFWNSINYDSTSNILGVKKFYDSGDISFKKGLKHGPVRINGHQILTFHFSRPKIHSLIHFCQFSLTKILLAASEMHEDNV